MKKLGFLMLAAGMLFAACSSDKDVATETGQNPLVTNGNGYFKVNLNLPTQVVTSNRAAGDGWGESTSGNLSDGLSKEYDVSSVLLLIFEGATESSATLKQVITPTAVTDPGAEDDPNQVTAAKTYLAKLNSAPAANLYALAVINGTGILEAGTTSATIKLNGSATDYAGSVTLSTLQSETTSNSMINSDKYFMTNAVLSKKKGGDTNPTATPEFQVLSPITPEFIYETESAAISGAAATDIYVERGMAKVTATNAITLNSAIKLKGSTAPSLTFSGWVLDNTENTSYIVRKVPTSFTWNLRSHASITTDQYRFVGGNAVDKLYGTNNLYRTYWAEDPNYTSISSPTYTTNTSLTFSSLVGTDNPQYCHENTFDVSEQVHKNTTRMVVKVNLSGADFYTIGADRKTLYTLDKVKDLVVTDLMNQTIFASWWATQSSNTLTKEDLTITFSSPEAGVITVSDITVDKTKCDKTTPGTNPSVNAELPAVLSTLNNNQLARVEYFKGGDVYYVIRIKHFGDELTPWHGTGTAQEWTAGNEPANTSVPSPTQADKIAAIYPSTPGQDANYLGRYGMVRNNWYDIRLGEILKIGSSTVPSLPGDDTPDDELDELYIKARINILSWAKRTQNWNLK